MVERLKHIKQLIEVTYPHNTYLVKQIQLLENDLELELKKRELCEQV